MRAEDLVGMTLREAAKKTNVRYKGYRVFLRRPEEEVGRALQDFLELNYAIKEYPEIADKKIVKSFDYYGTWIIKVEI